MLANERPKPGKGGDRTMRLTVLGCGEAFDESYPNTSLLLAHEEQTLLLDCGYSVPQALWGRNSDPAAVDLIYISHAHADHYYGLPALLGRMWEEGRTKPLVLLSQPAILEKIGHIMELGYSNLAARFEFPIERLPAEPGREVEWKGFRFDFAPSKHSTTNLAVRVRRDGKAFCYSGDGMFTPQGRELFQGANLLVHEAFSMQESPVHGDIPNLVRMAEEQQVEELLLVHLQRTLRRRPEQVHDIIRSHPAQKTGLPEPGDEFSL
jgi:ribonuclease Z